MAKTVIGRNLPLYKGDYNSSTTYDIYDVVVLNGSSYVSKKKNNAGNNPGENTEYWQLLAKCGAKGDKGNKGEKGDTPVAGVDYYTNEERERFKNAVIDASKQDIENLTETKITEFNSNATEKTNTFNTNATQKVSDYNENHTAKLSEYNRNAEELISSFDIVSEYIDAENDTVVTEEGTETTIEDSAKWYGKIDVKGRTEQESYEGRNLYNSATKTDNTVFIWSTGAVGGESNGDIVTDYINCSNVSKIYSNYVFYVFCYDNNKSYLGNSVDLRKTGGATYSNFDIPEGVEYVRLQYKMNATSTDMTTVTDIMVSRTEAELTPYEKYVGGQPSPSTEYPQAIKNVEGNVDFVVCNKNLFNRETITNNCYIDDHGDIKQQENVFISDFIKIEKNENYYLSGRSNWQNFAIYDKTKMFICRKATQTANGIINISENNCQYIRIIGTGTDRDTMQFEKGASATEYLKGNPQTITFPLANAQKLMEGDYLAGDGVHHVKGQKTVDGTENWQLWTLANAVNVERFYIRDFIFAKNASMTKCNWFVYVNGNNDYEHFRISADNEFAIYVPKEIATTTNELKSYLAEKYANGTPLIAEYELKTEVVDPYTPAQQEAYNKLQKLMLNHGTNHIWTETEGLNPNMKVTYKQSHKIKSQKEIEDIKNAIISMGGNI